MANYQVTDTKEIKTMTQAGSEKTVFRVWIVTENGSAGSVDVSQSKWNKDDLPGILSDKADELDLAFAVLE